MAEQDQPTGRALVRARLIDRLNEAGLKPRRGVRREVQEATERRLVELLAYMTAANLETLAETLLDHAEGGAWPSETLVRTWAKALQPAPAVRRPIVTSWLASVEGPRALAEGQLVELFRFLARKGMPPLAMDRRRIAEEASDNARRRARLEERQAFGALSDEDAEWLRRYETDRREALALVANGTSKREGKTA